MIYLNKIVFILNHLNKCYHRWSIGQTNSYISVLFLNKTIIY